MIEGAEDLRSTAAIAVGIAGFSGVVAACFQQGGLHEFDRHRFLMLFRPVE